MYVNLINKSIIIRYKVITKKAFDEMVSLFDDFKYDVRKEYSTDLVEVLYEIKVGDQTYSGTSADEFKKIYNKKYRADYIKIVIHALSQEAGRYINPRTEHPW